jgi:hypothetical protein
MKERKSGKLKQLIFIIAISIAFFIGIEVLLRVYLWAKTGNNEYFKFSVEVTKLPREFISAKEYAITSKKISYSGYYKLTRGRYELMSLPFEYSINSLGFRVPEFKFKKNAGTTRICALGSSTTFGLGVEDSQAYPVHLEEELNRARNNKYEVINCGIPSYVMYNILNLFSKEIISYRPDIIVVSESINDAIYVTPELKGFLFSLHKALYYRSMLYTLMLEKYSLYKRHSPDPFFLFSNKEIPGYYSDYLQRIIDSARDEGIIVILVSEPILSDIKFSDSLDELGAMCKNTSDTSVRNLIKQRYYNKQMELIAKEII